MKVAVCDDEKNIRTYIAALVRQQGISCEIREYASASDCIEEAGEYDILFLDIELEGGDLEKMASEIVKIREDITGSKGSGENKDFSSGMAVARQIRSKVLIRQPVIIFVTGHEKYIYDAFDVGAFQYILKPIHESRFAEIFRRAAEYAASEAERLDRKLMIPVGGMNKAVPCADIYYVESRGHKAILCMRGQVLECWMRIGELEEKLGRQFFRIHKGYLINLSYVDQYSRTEVVMANEDRLPLSKYKYADFVRAYLQFIQHTA